MLDLLIINPGATHGLTKGHAIYGDLGHDLIAIEPPLWARLIAGYVRDRGFTVRIVDLEADPSAVLYDSETPRLICIAVYGHQPSASTQQMAGAGLLARRLKDTAPQIPIIMVGGHVAALPERTLREEAIDYACNGEGPFTIATMLKNDRSLWREQIAGLVWWDGDTVVSNKAAPLLDVAELHGDAWDLLPMHLYRSHNWQCFGDLDQRQPYANIYTTLGCPYKCSFCCINAPFASSNTGGNSYRMREPSDVVDEIVLLWDRYGVKTIKIVDEMFVLNERHYTAICNLLINEIRDRNLPDDLNIWAYARVDTVKPHTLQMFRKAGIKWLALGIESGSAYVRDGSQKALKNDDIVGVVRAIQAAGINVIGNFIVGLPDDNLETMEQTYQLAADLNCEFMNVYSAMAYPGSSLYTQAISQGWALPSTWKGYSQHNEDCRPLDTKHVTGKQVLAFRDEFFRRYFNRPNYLAMLREKFGESTVHHVTAMLAFQLKRKLLEGEIE